MSQQERIIHLHHCVIPFHTHSSLPSTWMHQIMRANWIQLSGSCVDGYWVCAPLGWLLSPLGHPQATNWIIRVHARGLTHLTGQRRARRFALTLCFLMFDSLSLPTTYLNVRQLGQCRGLTLCLQVIIICILFFLIDWLWSAALLLGVTVIAS